MLKNIKFLHRNTLFFLLIALTVFLIGHSTTNASLAKKVIGNLAYWDQTRGFQAIKDNVNTLSEVSPNWYVLNAEGDVLANLRSDGSSYVDPSIISYLRTNNIKILPMIQNIVGGNWDSATVSNLINSPTLVSRHISNIVNLVVTAGYDGIDIDYENLLATDRQAFSNFVRDLSLALHAQNKILSINVHAKTSEPGNWNGPQSQDWSVIGAMADEVRIMIYGYSWQTSPAGPVAPIGWVNDVLNFAVSVIPKEKIIQGIPTYGLDWPEGSAGTEYMYDQFIALANNYNANINWDNLSKSSWFEYTAGGKKHTSWFENASSTEAKLDANNLRDIAGIFIWRLGGEDKKIWNSIRSKFGGDVLPAVPTANIIAGGLDGNIMILKNTSTSLSWSSTNADSCSVSPTGWTGTSNIGISTGNLSTTTTYSLSCTGIGGVASDSVTVNIIEPETTDTMAPTITITEPIASSTISRRVKIGATASDNVKVERVMFYIDDKLLSTMNTSPYVTYWNTQKSTSGVHIIKAIAYDGAGNSSTAQISVNIK